MPWASSRAVHQSQPLQDYHDVLNVSHEQNCIYGLVRGSGCKATNVSVQMSLGLPVNVIFPFAGIQSTSVIYNQMEAIAWGKGRAPSMQKLSNASPLGRYLKTAMIIIPQL